MFSHPDFKGRKKTITRSHAYISDIGWDDEVDGFRLSKRKPLEWEAAVNLMYDSGNKASFYHQHRPGSHNSYQSDDYIDEIFSLGSNQDVSIYSLVSPEHRRKQHHQSKDFQSSKKHGERKNPFGGIG